MEKLTKNQTTDTQDKWTKYHSLITYCTEQELVRIVNEHRPTILGCSYIFHEADETNLHKHFHVAMALNRTFRVSAVRGWFKTATDETGRTVSTLGQPVKSFLKLHDYFKHIDDESVKLHKKQYTDVDIKVLNEIPEVWNFRAQDDVVLENLEKKEASADECERMIQDIIDGVPSREMARRYGRDYMKNHGKYREFASCVVLEETGNIDMAQRIAGTINPFMTKVQNESYVRGYEFAMKSMLDSFEKLSENGALSIDIIKNTLYRS